MAVMRFVPVVIPDRRRGGRIAGEVVGDCARAVLAGSVAEFADADGKVRDDAIDVGLMRCGLHDEIVIIFLYLSEAGLPTNRGSHAAVAAAARGTPEARSSPSGMGTSW